MKAVYTIEDLRHWQEPALRYAVLGDPVVHSASPAMHNAALEFLGRPERYCRLWIQPDQLKEAIRLLPEAEFLGVNLTIPHKTGILPLLDKIDPPAERLGAVNTVAIRGEKTTGFNTDGPGLVSALREDFGTDVAGLSILILGAGGGAGRAIATQVAIDGARKVLLANRTFEKAQLLAGELGPAAQAIPWEDECFAHVLRDVDLIINASAVGMKSSDISPISEKLLEPKHMVYDTIYVGDKTPLQRAAEVAGARSANGLSLLLHQGALALGIWLGQPAPLEIMRQGLRGFVADKRDKR